eukprot:TRINITY_DN7829_c0_g1_i1.p1 TRINITY_DN7829_c0_g1~~TRINITY_DN7829_c0_g1_i1.p1  ORF type:complete len:2451 (+),score=352.13 TRINITY_DN7829_c0_g1_i1:70-7422(+)
MNTEDLFAAIEQGAAQLVETLLDIGIPVNVRDTDGQSALASAVFNGRIEVVQLLVTRGAAINEQDEDGTAPLHIAVQEGHSAIIEFLLQSGAAVDLADNEGDCALLMAIEEKRSDIVQILLRNGAAADRPETPNRQPVLLAAALCSGGVELLQILLAHGASISTVDEGRGMGVLDVAVQHNNIEMVRFLMHEPALSVRPDHVNGNMPPLFRAARNGLTDVAQLLVDAGASLELPDKNGFTPLCAAVLGDHHDTVEYLLTAGSDVHARVVQGSTALHIAVVRGNTAIVQLLIDSGAQLSEVDNMGETPLYKAAKAGNIGVVELLVERGADPNGPRDSPMSILDLLLDQVNLARAENRTEDANARVRLMLHLLDRGARSTSMAVSLCLATETGSFELTESTLKKDEVQTIVALLRSPPEDNHSVSAVNLQGDSFEPEELQAVLVQALASSQALQRLNLSGIRLTVKAMEALIEGLRFNQSLVELRLRDVHVTPTILESMFTVLQRNKTLLFLDVAGNDGCSAANVAKFAHSHLQQFHLSLSDREVDTDAYYGNLLALASECRRILAESQLIHLQAIGVTEEWYSATLQALISGEPAGIPDSLDYDAFSVSGSEAANEPLAEDDFLKVQVKMQLCPSGVYVKLVNLTRLMKVEVRMPQSCIQKLNDVGLGFINLQATLQPRERGLRAMLSDVKLVLEPGVTKPFLFVFPTKGQAATRGRISHICAALNFELRVGNVLASLMASATPQPVMLQGLKRYRKTREIAVSDLVANPFSVNRQDFMLQLLSQALQRASPQGSPGASPRKAKDSVALSFGGDRRLCLGRAADVRRLCSHNAKAFAELLVSGLQYCFNSALLPNLLEIDATGVLLGKHHTERLGRLLAGTVPPRHPSSPAPVPALLRAHEFPDAGPQSPGAHLQQPLLVHPSQRSPQTLSSTLETLKFSFDEQHDIAINSKKDLQTALPEMQDALGFIAAYAFRRATRQDTENNDRRVMEFRESLSMSREYIESVAEFLRRSPDIRTLRFSSVDFLPLAQLRSVLASLINVRTLEVLDLGVNDRAAEIYLALHHLLKHGAGRRGITGSVRLNATGSSIGSFRQQGSTVLKKGVSFAPLANGGTSLATTSVPLICPQITLDGVALDTADLAAIAEFPIHFLLRVKESKAAVKLATKVVDHINRNVSLEFLQLCSRRDPSGFTPVRLAVAGRRRELIERMVFGRRDRRCGLIVTTRVTPEAEYEDFADVWGCLQRDNDELLPLHAAIIMCGTSSTEFGNFVALAPSFSPLSLHSEKPRRTNSEALEIARVLLHATVVSRIVKFASLENEEREANVGQQAAEPPIHEGQTNSVALLPIWDRCGLNETWRGKSTLLLALQHAPRAIVDQMLAQQPALLDIAQAELVARQSQFDTQLRKVLGAATITPNLNPKSTGTTATNQHSQSAPALRFEPPTPAHPPQILPSEENLDDQAEQSSEMGSQDMEASVNRRSFDDLLAAPSSPNKPRDFLVEVAPEAGEEVGHDLLHLEQRKDWRLGGTVFPDFDWGLSLAHWAALTHHADLLQQLLDFDPTLATAVTARLAYTPLHYAAYSGSEECTVVLVRIAQQEFKAAGMPTQLPAPATSLSLHSHSSLASHAPSIGRDPSLSFSTSAPRRSVVNQCDAARGNSALHIAAMYGHVDCLALLLQSGADVSMLNTEGVDCHDISIVLHAEQQRGNDEAPTKEGHDAQFALAEVVNLLNTFPPIQSKLSSFATRMFLKNTSFYLLFLIVLTIVVAYATNGLSQRGIQTHYKWGGMLVPGDITSIETSADMWQWISGPFFETYFSSQGGHNYLLPVTARIVGAVRLRQVRVRPQSCSDADGFPFSTSPSSSGDSTLLCVGDFSEAHIDDRPLDGSKYVRPLHHRLLAGENSRLGLRYGRAGHVVDLDPTNATAVNNTLASLISVGWVDLRTRVVVIDVNLFKPNIDRWIVVKILFEFPATGGVVASSQYTLARHQFYATARDKGILVLELFLCAVFTYVLFDEIQEFHAHWSVEEDQLATAEAHATAHSNDIRRVGRARASPWLTRLRSSLGGKVIAKVVSFQTRDWNAVDIFGVVLFGACLGIRVELLRIAEEVRKQGASLSSVHATYLDLHDLAAYTVQQQNSVAFLLVISWIKLLKYFVVLPSLGPVANAIMTTITDFKIVIFVLVFVEVLLSLVFGFHYSFGHSVSDYRSFEQSIYSMLQLVFGIWDFQSLFNSSRVMGPVLFLVALVGTNLVLLNILIAVVSDVYYERLATCQSKWYWQIISPYHHELVGHRRKGAFRVLVESLRTAFRCRGRSSLVKVLSARFSQGSRFSGSLLGGIQGPVGNTVISHWAISQAIQRSLRQKINVPDLDVKLEELCKALPALSAKVANLQHDVHVLRNASGKQYREKSTPKPVKEPPGEEPLADSYDLHGSGRGNSIRRLTSHTWRRPSVTSEFSATE